MENCKKCGEIVYSGDCNCKKFVVEEVESGECGIFFAVDEEAAALSYAKDYDQRYDHRLVGDEITLKVNGLLFVVEAEPDVHYSISKL